MQKPDKSQSVQKKIGTLHKRPKAIALILTALCLQLMTPLLISTALATPVPRIKPIPPAPVWLSPADYQILGKFFNALDKKNTNSANSWREKIKDPVARSVADWAWFRQDTNLINYQEAGVFLDSHLDWPSAKFIQRNAEKRITNNTSVTSIEDFFRNRQPISGRGKIQLARANIAKGRLDLARELIVDGWVNHDWPAQEEQKILARYGQYMTSIDHWEKADRQLFEIKATTTRRLLPYLNARDRRKAEARIALLRRASTAPKLISRLTADDQKDPGVLHALTRYYRRKGEEPTAIAYALQAPLSSDLLRNTKRWWTEKRLLLRWALKNGRYEDAYSMAAFSGLVEGGNFADAEFAAGWIALRFLNDPTRARPHFAYLDAGVTAPISKARAQYWLGRTFEASNDFNRAGQHYAVSAAYPFTYYGMLAQEKLTLNDTLPRFPAATAPSPDTLNIFNARPLVYAMRILAELDRDNAFITFARQLDDQLQSAGEYTAYEDFMIEEGKVFLSVRAGKVAAKNGAAAPHVSYPLISVPEEASAFTSTEFILGLSRQESEFNPRAYSSAKARGLMQLLSSTARLTARKEGLPYSTSRLRDDPSYNMIIGAAHLKHLRERFDGSWIMTMAAYNAGPSRVDQWIATYGDPRNPDVDPVDWVELIPFGETRNYVQRVSENVQIYRARLTNTPIAGQLSRDLVRGGGTISAIGINPPSPVLERLASQQNGRRVPPQKATQIPAAMTEPRLPNKKDSPPLSPRIVATPNTQPNTTTVKAPSFPAPRKTAPKVPFSNLTEKPPCPSPNQPAKPVQAEDLNTKAFLDYLDGAEKTPC